MNDTKKKVYYLDATATKDCGCMHRANQLIVHGRREKGFNSRLLYGTAVHKFAAELRRSKGNFEKALTETVTWYLPKEKLLPPKDFRTTTHLSVTLASYYQQVYKTSMFSSINNPLKPDELLIEQKFDVNIFDLFPDLKEHLTILFGDLDKLPFELHIAGTIDEVGLLESDNIVVKDIKTMTSNKYYINENLKAYQLSIQLLFYIMLVEHLFKIKNVGAFIEAVCIDKEAPTCFATSELFQYSEQQRNNFKNLLQGIIIKFYHGMVHGQWEKNYLLCNNSITTKEKVNKCMFFKSCAAPDEELEQHYLTADFDTREYNPLTFDMQYEQ